MYTITRQVDLLRENHLKVARINFQLWLSAEDAERYQQVVEIARKRQSRARDSDINRRLLGLDMTEDLLTTREILFFQGRAPTPVNKAAVSRVGKAVTTPADDAEDIHTDKKTGLPRRRKQG